MDAHDSTGTARVQAMLVACSVRSVRGSSLRLDGRRAVASLESSSGSLPDSQDEFRSECRVRRRRCATVVQRSWRRAGPGGSWRSVEEQEGPENLTGILRASLLRRLRGWRSQERGGSNPPFRTSYITDTTEDTRRLRTPPASSVAAVCENVQVRRDAQVSSRGASPLVKTSSTGGLRAPTACRHWLFHIR